MLILRNTGVPGSAKEYIIYVLEVDMVVLCFLCELYKRLSRKVIQLLSIFLLSQDHSSDPPSKPPAESSGFRVTDIALNATILKMQKHRISHNRSGDSIEGCSDIIGTSLSDAPPCPPPATDDNQIKSNNQRNSSGSNSPGGPPIPAVRVPRRTQQTVDSPHPGAPGMILKDYNQNNYDHSENNST